MMCPACLINHGTIGSLAATLAPIFSSRAILNVLATPSKLPMALSMVPLESESPTRELSRADPKSHSLFFCISLSTSTMAGS